MKDSSQYCHQLLNDSFIYLAFFASNTGPSNTVGTESDCVTADPGILAWSHAFVEIDHEIFSMAILLPP